MSAQLYSLSELFNSAKSRLKQANCNFTEAEIVYLWKLACKLAGEDLKDFFSRQDHRVKIFNLLVEKRAQGVPTPLIEGKVSFNGIQILVAPGVFIPRPETEELALLALKEAKKIKEKLDVLDIGTGSGAIAIFLAKNLPDAFVVATDISEASISLARKNARLNQVKNIKILKISYEELAKNDKKYDLVVSNPPYIPFSDRASLPREVVEWEPKEALFGGEDGLDFYRKFALTANRIIKPGGVAFLEFGCNQEKELCRIFRRSEFKFRFNRDINGKERFIELRKID